MWIVSELHDRKDRVEAHYGKKRRALSNKIFARTDVAELPSFKSVKDAIDTGQIFPPEANGEARLPVLGGEDDDDDDDGGY